MAKATSKFILEITLWAILVASLAFLPLIVYLNDMSNEIKPEVPSCYCSVNMDKIEKSINSRALKIVYWGDYR